MLNIITKKKKNKNIFSMSLFVFKFSNYKDFFIDYKKQIDRLFERLYMKK